MIDPQQVAPIVIEPMFPNRPVDCYCRVCNLHMRGHPGEPCPWCVERSQRRR